MRYNFHIQVIIWSIVNIQTLSITTLSCSIVNVILKDNKDVIVGLPMIYVLLENKSNSSTRRSCLLFWHVTWNVHHIDGGLFWFSNTFVSFYIFVAIRKLKSSWTIIKIICLINAYSDAQDRMVLQVLRNIWFILFSGRCDLWPLNSQQKLQLSFLKLQAVCHVVPVLSRAIDLEWTCSCCLDLCTCLIKKKHRHTLYCLFFLTDTTCMHTVLK